jgi:hypothetical protein
MAPKKRRNQLQVTPQENMFQVGQLPQLREKLKRSKLAEYPNVIFEQQDADPEFISAVEEAVKKIDFLDEGQISPFHQMFLKMGKTVGFDKAFRFLQTHLIVQNDGSVFIGEHEALSAYLAFGAVLLDLIPEYIRRKHMPFNNVKVHYEGHDIVLRFTSTRFYNRTYDRIYYSPHKPTITFDSKEYTVGFCKHAITRICERIRPGYIEYPHAGEIHAFFLHCVYFEPTLLLDNNPAFVIYDLCNDPRVTQYKAYTVEVFGEQNIIPEAGMLYYKIGYCPVYFDDGFAVAKTFLPVGFSKTPEYGLLRNAKISWDQKEKLKSLAKQEDESEFDQFCEKSIQDIKWFHQNGMPQVVQMKHVVFRNWHAQ